MAGEVRRAGAGAGLRWRTPRHPAGTAPAPAAALETSQALEAYGNRAADGPCIAHQPPVRSSEQINPQNRHGESSEETSGEEELGQGRVWSFENSSPGQEGAGSCCCSRGVSSEAGAPLPAPEQPAKQS